MTTHTKPATGANAPIEVQARDKIAAAVVALFAFEKKASETIKAQREAAWNDVHTLIKSAGKLTDEEINHVGAAFGVALAKAGFKKESIYTKKSELRRMLEHSDVIPDDCTGWKAALRAITEATVDSLELLRRDVQTSLDAIAKAEEGINKMVAGYADQNGMTYEEATAKVQAAMVTYAASQNSNVGPINKAAETLRNFKPSSVTAAVQPTTKSTQPADKPANVAIAA